MEGWTRATAIGANQTIDTLVQCYHLTSVPADDALSRVPLLTPAVLGPVCVETLFRGLQPDRLAPGAAVAKALWALLCILASVCAS